MNTAITLDRRTAAIFYSDVVGYSRLMGADEIGTISALRATLNTIALPAIQNSSGRLIQVAGDAILAEFPGAPSAVDCAVNIQRRLAERNVGIDPERRIEFRIGVNYGEILADEERIFGDTVNVAARLEGIAEPGGLAISRKVLETITDRKDLVFESLGERRLKKIAQPGEVFRLASGRPSPPLEPATLTLPQRPSIAILPFDN